MPKVMSKETFLRITAMLEDGEYSLVAISKLVGVHSTAISAIDRGLHFYQADEAEQARRRGKTLGPSKCYAHYLPTPEEITEACERLQAERRLVASEDEPAGWMPPVYSELDLIGA